MIEATKQPRVIQYGVSTLLGPEVRVMTRHIREQNIEMTVVDDMQDGILGQKGYCWAMVSHDKR